MDFLGTLTYETVTLFKENKFVFICTCEFYFFFVGRYLVVEINLEYFVKVSLYQYIN